MDAVNSLSQEQIKAARIRFAEGETIPSSLIDEAVVRSWERSRAAGVSPWQRPRFERVGSRQGVRDPRTDRRLYHCVRNELDALWAAFGGPQWVVFCTNHEGTVIHARQSPYLADPRLQPLTTGCMIAESTLGTTAPACVLCDGAEVVVDGNQHYLDDFASLFCYCVPLRGFDGETIGTLDITGRGERRLDTLRQHFRQASLSIEMQWLATLRTCHLLRVQHDPRWLDTPLAGVLAVDEDRKLRAASLMARRMLGLPRQGSVRGRPVDELLPEATPVQRRRLLVGSRLPQRIGLRDGSFLYVKHSRAPLMAKHDPQADSAGDGLESSLPAGDWREQNLRAIAHALAQYDGNIAATARHLRMSRTTLYAKLRELHRTGLL